MRYKQEQAKTFKRNLLKTTDPRQITSKVWARRAFSPQHVEIIRNLRSSRADTAPKTTNDELFSKITGKLLAIDNQKNECKESINNWDLDFEASRFSNIKHRRFTSCAHNRPKTQKIGRIFLWTIGFNQRRMRNISKCKSPDQSQNRTQVYNINSDKVLWLSPKTEFHNAQGQLVLPISAKQKRIFWARQFLETYDRK